MGPGKVTIMKDSTQKPEFPRLVASNGAIVGEVTSPSSSVPAVDVYPPLRLIASNGVVAGSNVDKKAVLEAIVPPPELEMFTDEEAEKHGADTDEKFESIVQTSLGDAASRGAKIIAGRPNILSEQLGDK